MIRHKWDHAILFSREAIINIIIYNNSNITIIICIITARAVSVSDFNKD